MQSLIKKFIGRKFAAGMDAMNQQVMQQFEAELIVEIDDKVAEYQQKIDGACDVDKPHFRRLKQFMERMSQNMPQFFTQIDPMQKNQFIMKI